MRPPLISVIGATGTGKSQLAVELALALNGEVINADAMQLYRGLPIITNKITDDERRGVPHHLLGFLDTKDVWQVGRFVREAETTADLDKIEDIRQRGRLPILVGGTHYYVQSLLFPHSIPQDEEKETPNEESEHISPLTNGDIAKQYPVLEAPTQELYEALRAIDPIMAARWHPNDRRKIRRSLEIYYSSGCKQTASEVYAAQRAAKEQPAETASSRPKHRNLIFWVHAETDILRARLESRVDKMIDSGMWKEIEQMEQLYSILGGNSLDLNTGIWQSIGFKEFLFYLEMRKAGLAVEKDIEMARATAVENMKTATKQYAKAQVRWIRIKFLNALRSAADNAASRSIFLLDSTNIPQYDKKVVEPALTIAKDFLAGNPLPDPLEFSPLAKVCLTPQRDYDISQRPDLWVQHICEVCNVTSTNELEWQYHMEGSRHKKKVKSAKKRKEIDEYLRKRKENQEKAAQSLRENEDIGQQGQEQQGHQEQQQ